jgi:ligand-binding SRPBCC domain-containing protein
MAVYTRRTRVDAPLDDVWEFHSRVDGLEALTPSWMHLRVEAVRGPDGEPDPDVLEAGSRARLSIRPFGLGPRQRWVIHIVSREEYDGAGAFVDEMERGPFRTWRHTHRFFADGDGTILSDRVEYELPLGPLGSALGPLGKIGFEPMFSARHRQTRELLE